MDAFELIIGQLLQEENYWIRYSVKINLTPEEKRAIGKPSAPRPEIDIIALDLVSNRIHLIEVKSFLDSKGVCFEDIVVENEQQEGKYKLLTSQNYRSVLSNRLRIEWIKDGVINEDTQISFGFIAGKIYQNKECELEEFFNTKEWMFWGPSIIREKMRSLVNNGYENNPVTIATKLLLR